MKTSRTKKRSQMKKRRRMEKGRRLEMPPMRRVRTRRRSLRGVIKRTRRRA